MTCLRLTCAANKNSTGGLRFSGYRGYFAGVILSSILGNPVEPLQMNK